MVAGALKSARRRPRGSSRRGTPVGAAPAAPPAESAAQQQPAETKPAPAPASSGGGSAGPFILGVLAYAWVVLPLIQGGPSRVKDVWRAKWLNRGPKGQVLP